VRTQYRDEDFCARALVFDYAASLA